MYRFVFMLSVFCFDVAFAQSPYKSYSSTDNIILGITAVGGLSQAILQNNMKPLTPEPARETIG